MRPLKDWLLRAYGDAIADPSSLRSAFVTNQAYAGLRAPVRQVAPGRFVPDFGARYLAEDVPFGLAVAGPSPPWLGWKRRLWTGSSAWAGERLGKDYLGGTPAWPASRRTMGLDSLNRLLAFTAGREGSWGLGIGDSEVADSACQYLST